MKGSKTATLKSVMTKTILHHPNFDSVLVEADGELESPTAAPLECGADMNARVRTTSQS